MNAQSQQKRTRVIVNVLNITDEELAGAAIFTRNVLSAWLAKENTLDVVVLHSSTIDVKKVLRLPDKANVKTRRVSASNFIARIIYEQLVLPFVVGSYDVYYSPTQVFPFVSRFFSRRTRMVITVHDMIPFFVKNKYGFLRTQYVKCISKWGPILADHVVVVSQNTLNDVVALTKIPASKVSVVYNFLTTAYYPENVNDKHFFVCISTVEPGKNLENTLAGYARFVEKYQLKNYCFYWLGKIGWGYTAEELNAKIASMGLQNNFRLLGFVPEAEKEAMLRDCTAMIYLSHYEGFGIPVLEGLYYNKPALVSRSSSLPEVIGSAGIMCNHNNVEEIADSMFLLISDLNKYRVSIPVQIRKFDKDVQIQNFMRIIHEQ